MKSILIGRYVLPHELDDSARELISALLKRNVTERCSAEDALKSDFCRKMIKYALSPYYGWRVFVEVGYGERSIELELHIV